MAEEAIGLAKSLDWVVEWGPNYLVPKVPLLESSEVLVEPVAEKNTNGRVIDYQNKVSVEGEKLKNWDRVEVSGTGMKGYYYNGKMLLDLDETDEESDEEEIGDEWTNAELRQSIALSNMIRIRKPSANHFFGSGKVLEIASFISEKYVSTLFINTILTASQQRNIER